MAKIETIKERQDKLKAQLAALRREEARLLNKERERQTKADSVIQLLVGKALLDVVQRDDKVRSFVRQTLLSTDAITSDERRRIYQSRFFTQGSSEGQGQGVGAARSPKGEDSAP